MSNCKFAMMRHIIDPRKRTRRCCLRAAHFRVKLKVIGGRRAVASERSSACCRLEPPHSQSQRNCRCPMCRTWRCSLAWTSAMPTAGCWKATAWIFLLSRCWACGGIFHFVCLSIRRHFRWRTGHCPLTDLEEIKKHCRRFQVLLVEWNSPILMSFILLSLSNGFIRSSPSISIAVGSVLCLLLGSITLLLITLSHCVTDGCSWRFRNNWCFLIAVGCWTISETFVISGCGSLVGAWCCEQGLKDDASTMIAWSSAHS